MFWAACRKSWLSCAKGHTHRLTVSTAATCHYDKTSANLPLKSTTSPLRMSSRVRDWRAGAGAPLWAVDQSWTCRDQTSLFSVVCRLKLSKQRCRPPSSAFGLYGTNGFCTEASKKPVLEETSSEKDSRGKTEDQAAENEGHFQFKELVSEPGLLFKHMFDLV